MAHKLIDLLAQNAIEHGPREPIPEWYEEYPLFDEYWEDYDPLDYDEDDEEFDYDDEDY